MSLAEKLVVIQEYEDRSGLLKSGDVRISEASIQEALTALPEGAELERAVVAGLEAPYKRVLLSTSNIHDRARHRKLATSEEHLTEAVRQHRLYFKRRGVATSLEGDPRLYFGDKGVTGTADDRDVFLAFMRRIGLHDVASPNAIAAAVIKGFRANPLTQGLGEQVFATLFEAMASLPGQNVKRSVYDRSLEKVETPMDRDAVYELLCELTAKRYDMINAAIERAHHQLQLVLKVEKEGIATFSMDNPFGLAIPYEGSLFRVYELDDAHQIARVCPAFFTVAGGDTDEGPVKLFAISHGDFSDLDGVRRFRIGEVYVPITRKQLERVGEFAMEHCEFNVNMLQADADRQLGEVLDGSSGAVKKVRLRRDSEPGASEPDAPPGA